MSSTSSESSLSTSEHSTVSLDDEPSGSGNEVNNEKIATKEPGPVEKQIEEYLKNWDPKSRFKKRKEENAESGCEKGVLSDQEQTICLEDVSTRYLTPEEVAFFQPYQSSPYMSSQGWQNLNESSNIQLQSQINPKIMTQYSGNPWYYSIPQVNPLENTEFSKSSSPIPKKDEDSNKTEAKYPQYIGNMQTFPDYKAFGPQQAQYNYPYGAGFVDQNKGGLYTNYAGMSFVNEQKSENPEMQDDSRFIAEQEKITSLSQEVEKLSVENQELRKQLKEQSAKLDSHGPRYKYLEENFEDFIKMKDEYLKLKNDKCKELGLKETYDKFVQTWSTTIMCESCVKTNEMLRKLQIQSVVNLDKEAFCVSRNELSELTAKFRTLKENISERERDYENRGEKAELIHLTALNVSYRTRIIELETKNRQTIHWADALQKVIAKVYSEQSSSSLTTQEEKWVERILNKFAGASEDYESASVAMTQDDAIEPKMFNVVENIIENADLSETSCG